MNRKEIRWPLRKQKWVFEIGLRSTKIYQSYFWLLRLNVEKLAFQGKESCVEGERPLARLARSSQRRRTRKERVLLKPKKRNKKKKNKKQALWEFSHCCRTASLPTSTLHSLFPFPFLSYCRGKNVSPYFTPAACTPHFFILLLHFFLTAAHVKLLPSSAIAQLLAFLVPHLS